MTICFGALSKPLLLLPPQLWELIGGEKPGRMPRWSRLFYEDWRRGRRGIQALACVLARVGSQGGNPSLAAASRRTSTAEVSISLFQLSCWKLHVCSCVCLCVGDYMVCVSVCARVCVHARACGCWKICYSERWILMTFVNPNTWSRPAVDETEVFSACFEFI